MSQQVLYESLQRSFFCSLITIGYIELQTCSMGHSVFDVVEVDAPLFSQQCESALSLTHLRMILHVPTSAL